MCTLLYSIEIYQRNEWSDQADAEVTLFSYSIDGVAHLCAFWFRAEPVVLGDTRPTAPEHLQPSRFAGSPLEGDDTPYSRWVYDHAELPAFTFEGALRLMGRTTEILGDFSPRKLTDDELEAFLGLLEAAQVRRSMPELLTV